jgi:hypothetical protein
VTWWLLLVSSARASMRDKGTATGGGGGAGRWHPLAQAARVSCSGTEEMDETAQGQASQRLPTGPGDAAPWPRPPLRRPEAPPRLASASRA